MTHTASERTSPNVASPAQAAELGGQVLVAIQRLADVLDRETTLLKDYRLQEALGLSAEKSEAARVYVQALIPVKANAVALGRWAPDRVGEIRRAQARLGDVVSLNMTVLATARSVSEGILRSLAAEVAAPRTLTTYGAAGRAQNATRPVATPLAVSRSL
ncbi:hypothetical protein NK718_02225 [Alsobacter sp. SYSU M60028]|uniref:Flagellar protein FlgN n=1 Tax=Alsobacter ponti TaxID=2962936 RepID=A0ABT1L785_9HYPH|nr:hypothetical protein [Alsobacter ponti]MCP8937320.1 hypothetical protein [Alsobacter ponti]